MVFVATSGETLCCAGSREAADPSVNMPKTVPMLSVPAPISDSLERNRESSSVSSDGRSCTS